MNSFKRCATAIALATASAVPAAAQTPETVVVVVEGTTTGYRLPLADAALLCPEITAEELAALLSEAGADADVIYCTIPETVVLDQPEVFGAFDFDENIDDEIAFGNDDEDNQDEGNGNMSDEENSAEGGDESGGDIEVGEDNADDPDEDGGDMDGGDTDGGDTDTDTDTDTDADIDVDTDDVDADVDIDG